MRVVDELSGGTAAPWILNVLGNPEVQFMVRQPATPISRATDQLAVRIGYDVPWIKRHALNLS
jgi:hypothetical protein